MVAMVLSSSHLGLGNKCTVPIVRKHSSEKTFMDQYCTIESNNFTKKTFASGPQTVESIKVFSLENLPLYGGSDIACSDNLIPAKGKATELRVVG